MEQQRKIIVAGDELHFQKGKHGWVKVDINTGEMSTWLSPREIDELIAFLQSAKSAKK